MTGTKKVLLHICCASCAVYVHHKLTEDHGYHVTCFFYNPNIHPERECNARKAELERIAGLKNWDVAVIDDKDRTHMKEWFRRVKGHEKEPERGERCSICFHMRLERAFQYAKEHNYDAVTSTLSISPYKVTRQINAEGEKLAQAYGIDFLPENFKKQNGFNIGKKMAMDLGIEHQNYCGCVFSKLERLKKLEAKK